MIYNNFTRVLPLQTNVIVLEHPDNGYFYVHRSLYDQAVILKDRYGTSIPVLQNLIGGHPEWTCIQRFVDSVPEPLGILGYYLALMEEDIDSLEDSVGALHIISSNINLRNSITFPKEIRASIKFSVNIQDDYKVAYDRFFKESVIYDDAMNSVTGHSQSTSGVELDTEDEEEDGEPEDDFFSMLNDTSLFTAPEKESAPEVEPALEAPRSGLDIIKQRRRPKL